MRPNAIIEQAKQREYYAQTADAYDQAHWYENEFDFVLFRALINHISATSVLDIGSGTGRALLAAKECRPGIKAVGIEPSRDLRERGYAKGLAATELIDGDAQKLGFADNSFDLVCEFAALHHIPNPSLAVKEMLRVSRRAVLISDSNNFGQGSFAARCLKQIINAAGLWPLAVRIKTGGKGYYFSQEDGVSYSYSVFNDIGLVKIACERVYVFGEGLNSYRTSPGAVIFGLKR